MFVTDYRQKERRGAAAVEFALIAPLFVIMFFGIIEFGRAMMVQQIVVQASRDGAREAALPGATLDSVRDVVQQFADDSGLEISRDNIVATPDPASTSNNEPITVRVVIDLADVSWLPGTFLRSARLEGTTTMRSEGLD